MKASLKDLERVCAVAKAHGVDVITLQRIAQVEIGKPLGEFSKQEMMALERRICGADTYGNVGHIHTQGDV